MKTKYILQVLPILVLMIGLASCSKEDIIPAEEQKEYKVSLKFNGEINVSDFPLTRGTATNDLIGVQVYQDGTPYAHGLFDNVEDININLFSDHKYKFEVTIVKNGKTELYNFDNYYYAPFQQNAVICTALNNSFVYSSTSYITGLGKGYSRKTDGNYDYPNTDRFYGELDNYTPTVDGTVAIDLKRTSFGLKYELSGVTDGIVSITVSNTSRTFFENNSITTDYQSEEAIFTFSDVYSAWLYADSYIESITVSANWERGVGITQDLGSKTIQIKRNAMNIIRLKLSSVDYTGNIGIEVEEETDMSEENVTGTLE